MLRLSRLGLLPGRPLQQWTKQNIYRFSSHHKPKKPSASFSTSLIPRCSFPSTQLRQKPVQILRLIARSHQYSTVIVQDSRRSRRLPRILFLSLLSFGAFTLAFFYGLDHFFPFLPSYLMGSLPTDEETLGIYTPYDEIAREVDEHIKNHPYVQKIRADGRYTESRPHLKIPVEIRGHSLTAGTLTGENKIVVPPLYFIDEKSHELVSVFYLGSDVSGHPGIVHGGLLATMLDEGLARCCFPALPNKVAVTAMLNVEYKKPAMTGNFFVLKAKTIKVEGRKAFVEGHMELLVGEGEEADVLVKAKALFIEPKGAKAFTSIYKVT